MPMTPNVVDSNYIYENVLVYNLQRMNLMVRNAPDYYLQPDDKVRIHKIKKEKAMEKVDSNYFDGTWTVQGYVNKLILVTNNEGTTFLVLRWLLVRVS